MMMTMQPGTTYAGHLCMPGLPEVLVQTTAAGRAVVQPLVQANCLLTSAEWVDRTCGEVWPIHGPAPWALRMCVLTAAAPSAGPPDPFVPGHLYVNRRWRTEFAHRHPTLRVYLGEVHAYIDGHGHTSGPAWLEVGYVCSGLLPGDRHLAVPRVVDHGLLDGVGDAVGLLAYVNLDPPSTACVDCGELLDEAWFAARRALVDGEAVLQLGPRTIMHKLVKRHSRC